MRASATLLGLLLLAGCGGSTPTGPGQPQPPAQSYQIPVVETLTGAPLTILTLAALPAYVSIEVPGHVPHQRWVRSTDPVDVIADQGFDLAFYRELARGAIYGEMAALRVLTASPSIYLQTAGLSPANVAALEDAARFVVPALSGDRLQVAAWETGAEARPESAGWIVVDLVNNDEPCGLAMVGASNGHIWLNTATRCRYRGDVDPSVIAHELGHSLGFRHLSASGPLMSGVQHTRGSVVIFPAERHHAAIAYTRPRGNTDIDVDPVGVSAVSLPLLVLP